jgi:hypothetical protein
MSIRPIKRALIYHFSENLLLKAGIIILCCLFGMFAARSQDTAGIRKLRILSHDEFHLLGMKNPKKVNRRPIILKFRHTSGGELLYYGSSHTFDPKSKTIRDIISRWKDFNPDIAFWEGGNPDRPGRLSGGFDQIIKDKGEAGLVQYLANKNNVENKTLEPSAWTVITNLRKRFSDQEILIHGILTQTEQARRIGKSVNELDSIASIGMKKAHSAGFKDIPSNISEFSMLISKLIPGVSNWHEVDLDMVSPKPLHDPNTTIIQKISTESSAVRDRHMLTVLLNEVNKGKKVFVVVGASHLIMQEPGLAEFFQKTYRP